MFYVLFVCLRGGGRKGYPWSCLRSSLGGGYPLSCLGDLGVVGVPPCSVRSLDRTKGVSPWTGRGYLRPVLNRLRRTQDVPYLRSRPWAASVGCCVFYGRTRGTRSSGRCSAASSRICEKKHAAYKLLNQMVLKAITMTDIGDCVQFWLYKTLTLRGNTDHRPHHARLDQVEGGGGG